MKRAQSEKVHSISDITFKSEWESISFFPLFSFVVFSFFLRPRNKTNDSINQNRKVCIVFVLCIEMQICIAFSCRARTPPSPHPFLSSDRLACAFGIVCVCERVSVSARTPLALALSLIVISLAKQMRNIVVAQCVYIIYHLPSDFKASSCYHSLSLSLSPIVLVICHLIADQQMFEHL